MGSATDDRASASATESEKPKPIRVVHIINDLGLGGAESLLFRLATRNSPNEHIVVSVGGPAWYSSRLQNRQVSVHHLHITSPFAVPRGIGRLVRIIRESRADVIQCWLYRSNVFGGLVGKFLGKPVVWGIHCSSLEPLRLRSRMVARLGGLLARWVPDFIINCSARSEQLHRKLGYSAAIGAVVHNGYDADEFFPDEGKRRDIRQSLELSATDFVLATVARWDAQKDIPNLLTALRIVHENGVRLRCFLIGAGLNTENKDLAAAIQHAGGENFVVPLGPRSDIQKIVRALDLHVLASCGGEAFPNAVAETMLSGVPNIVTDVGDCALMVGRSGWVVPPQNPRFLAEAILEAFGQWGVESSEWIIRRRMARSQIAENFSFDRMVTEYENAWRHVIAPRELPPTKRRSTISLQ